MVTLYNPQRKMRGDRSVRVISAILALLVLCSSASFGTEPTQEQASRIDDGAKARAFYEAGISCYRQGRYEEALEAFMNTAQIDPHYRDLDYYLTVTKDSLALPEGELQPAEEALPRRAEAGEAKEGAGYISTLYEQGLYEMRHERYAEAMGNFQEVLRLDPRHQGAWHNLLESSFLEEKQRKEALERRASLIKEAVDKQLERLYRQGKTLFRYNRSEEALRKFEEISAINPNFRDVRAQIIKIRLELVVREREEKGSPYTLGPDDGLEINVQNHLELSGSVMIEPGGELILPLVKEIIQANGLTKSELEGRIKTVLGKYVKDPDVQVVITAYNSKKWYALGEVGFQGEFPMGKARLTLMEALYRAGLPRDGTSAMRRVLLIKPRKSKPYTKVIDVADILYKGEMKDNVFIEPGDVIYVPKTAFTKFVQITSTIAAPMAAARGTLTSLDDYLRFNSGVRSFVPGDVLRPRKTRRISYDTSSQRITESQ